MDTGIKRFTAQPLEYFSDLQMKDIHSASLDILEDCGTVVHHEEAVQLLKGAGAWVQDGNRVFIPTGLVEEAIRTAPSRVTIYDRNGTPAMFLEGCNVYYGTGSDTPHILDSTTGERRDALSTDVGDAVRLSDALPHIDFIMSMGLAGDIESGLQYQQKFAALQQPMSLGADIVLLSITKFLAGNATVLGGAVVGPEPLVEDIRWNTTEFVGSIMPPQEAWMTLQYLETLSMRMKRHSENALIVAEFLNEHPKVAYVNYSGLPGHPQHELACNQMKAHGGLLSFVAANGMQGAAKTMNAFKLICHAVTFGTSRSICMHPATITHEHLTTEEREEAGVDDGLIRLSVGLEDPDDIIADLDQALNQR